MSVVYLVRHVETPANVGEPVVRGNMDVPPDPRGIQQIQALSKKFAGKPVNLILSSPLARAMALAKGIQAATGARLEPVNALKSWDRGILTGKPESQAKPYVEWYFEHPTVPIPAGESYESFYTRWQQALTRILDLARKTGINIVVVTHAHNLNTAPSILTGGKEPIAVDSAPAPGSVLTLSSSGSGWKLGAGLGGARTRGVSAPSRRSRVLNVARNKKPMPKQRRAANPLKPRSLDGGDKVGFAYPIGSTEPGGATRGTIPQGLGGNTQMPENY